MKTHDPVKLGSPNVDHQRCKTTCSSSLLLFICVYVCVVVVVVVVVVVMVVVVVVVVVVVGGGIELDLQGQITLLFWAWSVPWLVTRSSLQMTWLRSFFLFTRCVCVRSPGPWFNIKMSSYLYRKSHCGDKTVVRSSYLHNGISYTGKMSSLYWSGALTASQSRLFHSLNPLYIYWDRQLRVIHHLMSLLSFYWS